jgi:flavodoxin
MKTCVIYFSQTGNTKLFAEIIAETLQTSELFDIANSDPSTVEDYEMLVIGTPTHGFRPSKEALAFVEGLPEGEGKRTAQTVERKHLQEIGESAEKQKLQKRFICFS